MIMAGKRLLDEFHEVIHINPSKNAKLHGMISSVSPMRRNSSGSTKYFDGALTDGKTKIRFVGFDGKQQQQLAEFQEKKEAVAIINCEVKPSKWGSELEVLMRKNTELLKSPTKFDIDVTIPQPTDDFEEITLDQLKDVSNYKRVTVLAKILSEDKVVELQNGLTKQDYVIGDSTGKATATVWENNVGLFSVGSSYKMAGVMVRVFNGKKYLSVPKEKSSIMIIDDIGAVKEDVYVEDVEDEYCVMKNAQVIGVLFLDKYSSCIKPKCKGKIQPQISPSNNIGKCIKCTMTQRIDAGRCKEEVSAKLMVEAEEVINTLTAFTSTLREICQGDISEDAFLNAAPFDLQCTGNIITNVNRYH